MYKKYQHLQYKIYIITQTIFYIICIWYYGCWYFFLHFLVKYYKAWLWLNLEREVNRNGGSINSLARRYVEVWGDAEYEGIDLSKLDDVDAHKE
jgi:hypothetical protein